MSVGALGALGVLRDGETPKRKAAGRAPAAAADESVKMRDLVVAAIPTELVATYTFLVATVVGFIDIEAGEHLDGFEPLRWALFAALVVGTGYFVWSAVRGKRPARNWRPVPALEMSSAVMAAITWGLTVPESPLQISLNGDNRVLVPVIVLMIGGTIYGAMANGLASQRRGTS